MSDMRDEISHPDIIPSDPPADGRRRRGARIMDTDDPEERADRLLAEYDHGPGAMARAEPVFQVPLSHLRAGRAGGPCKVCKLFKSDISAFSVISAMIIGGEIAEDIAAVAQRLGHDIKAGSIVNHRRKHVDPTMWEIARETAEFQMIARQAMALPTGDLATMQMQIVSAAMIEALRNIDRKRLAQIAADDPMALIQLANQHARALANVQSADRHAQLAAAKLKLEHLKADQAHQALLTRAMSALKRELESSPEGRKVLEAISALLDGPAE